MYARTYRIRQYEEKLFHDKSLSEIAFLLYAGIHMISEFMIACNFRKMLTLEQYRNSEMTSLYQKVLGNGPCQFYRGFIS